VDFVDEQHVVRFQVGQDGGQVAGPLQHRSRGLAQVHAHLGGHDVGQGGLAQARRAEQQDVVEGLAAPLGGVDEDGELLPDLGLTDVIRQALGPQGALDGFLLGRLALGADETAGVGVEGGIKGIGFDHGKPGVSLESAAGEAR